MPRVLNWSVTTSRVEPRRCRRRGPREGVLQRLSLFVCQPRIIATRKLFNLCVAHLCEKLSAFLRTAPVEELLKLSVSRAFEPCEELGPAPFLDSLDPARHAQGRTLAESAAGSQNSSSKVKAPAFGSSPRACSCPPSTKRNGISVASRRSSFSRRLR